MTHQGGDPRFARSGGILLHISSLPGRFGVGDLGPDAYRFVDFLAAHRQSIWQVLPLGPTSGGTDHSPYVTLSAFAGNPLFISIEALVEEQFLPSSTLSTLPLLPDGVADYAEATRQKRELLRRASANFTSSASSRQKSAFDVFCQIHQWWLDDYTLFMGLRETFHEHSWHTWDAGLVRRQPRVLNKWRTKLAREILFHKHQQFFFFTQWASLKAYANQRNVKIIGDLPIYVGFDSAEVWAHPELFQLAPQTFTPRVVAGVPPDMFSDSGQRWGNPLYRWWNENGQAVEEVYTWWLQRFRATLEMVDLVRVDHFRGFESYWAIPVEEETAINGQWVRGPGAELFSRVQETLGELPVIAEDLGVITPAVDALRLQFGFPGMKVLQFAFGEDSRNPYLPHNYVDSRYFVYTGTHDNDTTCGWFRSVSAECQRHVLRYLGYIDDTDIHWQMIRLAWSSIARLSVIPLQDLLGLGSEGRMNTPGRSQGNWRWRYTPDALLPQLGERLAELTYLYRRDES
ncbi:MAG: 4-alpha-glucanotransferase [Candidatus Binatia bacterium]